MVGFSWIQLVGFSWIQLSWIQLEVGFSWVGFSSWIQLKLDSVELDSAVGFSSKLDSVSWIQQSDSAEVGFSWVGFSCWIQLEVGFSWVGFSSRIQLKSDSVGLDSARSWIQLSRIQLSWIQWVGFSSFGSVGLKVHSKIIRKLARIVEWKGKPLKFGRPFGRPLKGKTP